MGIGLQQTPALILSGASLSAEIRFGTQVPIGIFMPAAWDAANLTFQVSVDDGVTWGNMYDSSGNEFTVNAAASRYLVLDPNSWVGVNHIKIRSGTASVPVNQTANRSLTFATRIYG